MTIPRNKTRLTTFSTTPRHLQMVEEILSTKEYLSKSEVMRSAIVWLHKKHFPYYKKVAEVRETKAELAAELMALPNEEYALEILKADSIDEERKAVFVHKKVADSEMRIPLDLIKGYASRKDVWESKGLAPDTENE